MRVTKPLDLPRLGLGLYIHPPQPLFEAVRKISQSPGKIELSIPTQGNPGHRWWHRRKPSPRVPGMAGNWSRWKFCYYANLCVYVCVGTCVSTAYMFPGTYVCMQRRMCIETKGQPAGISSQEPSTFLFWDRVFYRPGTLQTCKVWQAGDPVS